MCSQEKCLPARMCDVMSQSELTTLSFKTLLVLYVAVLEIRHGTVMYLLDKLTQTQVVNNWRDTVTPSVHQWRFCSPRFRRMIFDDVMSYNLLTTLGLISSKAFDTQLFLSCPCWSGLNFFCSYVEKDQKVPDASEEEGEIADARDKIQYDFDKLPEWPGNDLIDTRYSTTLTSCRNGQVMI